MTRILAAALACLLLAGCSGTTDDGSATPGAGDDLLGNATAPPQPLHWENDVVAGADPYNSLPIDPNDPTSLAGPGPCSQQVSSCEYYDFSVNGTFDLVATLAWGVAANDLDLYLYQGDTQVSQDGINGIPPAAGVPATQQAMRASVGPGEYTFWVVLWNAAADSYTLDAEFS